MIFAIGLKRVSDICFYLTFASIFASLFGETNLLSTLPVFVLVSFLSAFLNSRGKIKYLSLLLLPISIFLVPLNVVTIVALVPIFIYMAFTISRTYEFSSQLNYTDIFVLFFKVLLGASLLFVLILGVQTAIVQFNQTVFPFGIIFLLCSITLMRMLRHDVSVLNQPRFQILNALSLLGLIMGGLVLSSDIFLNVGRVSLYFLFTRVIAPILGLIIRIVLFILTPLFNLIGSLSGTEFSFPMEGGGEIDLEGMGELVGEGSETVNFLLYMGVAVLIIFVVIKIFKRFLKKEISYTASNGMNEIRKTLSDDKKSPPKSRRLRHNQIREIYRRFLILCQKEGIDIKPFMTSLDIEQQVSQHLKSNESKELRELYIKVRYNHSAYSKAEVKSAKALYKKISSQINDKH